MRVAIIGSAGQHGDADKFSREVFDKMISRCEEELTRLDNKDIHLVSGGAAWSDHLAVAIFLKSKNFKYPFEVESLTLHMPAFWDRANVRFYGTYYGNIANELHHTFGEKLFGGDRKTTLLEIGSAVRAGAKLVDHYNGFYERNISVGEVDAVIAFTFGTLGIPQSKGTLHTWENSSASLKVHVSIGSL